MYLFFVMCLFFSPKDHMPAWQRGRERGWVSGRGPVTERGRARERGTERGADREGGGGGVGRCLRFRV
jgi:hypothetical protein